MEQVTECFAYLEGENDNYFFIHSANEKGVVVFMFGYGYRQIIYSDIKRIVVRERLY